MFSTQRSYTVAYGLLNVSTSLVVMGMEDSVCVTVCVFGGGEGGEET